MFSATISQLIKKKKDYKYLVVKLISKCLISENQNPTQKMRTSFFMKGKEGSDGKRTGKDQKG